MAFLYTNSRNRKQKADIGEVALNRIPTDVMVGPYR
jgi:hypothetical protein